MIAAQFKLPSQEFMAKWKDEFSPHEFLLNGFGHEDKAYLTQADAFFKEIDNTVKPGKLYRLTFEELNDDE